MKSTTEIQAAAKILEACTFYAIYDEMIMIRRQNFSDNLRNYIKNHITEDLDAESIAAALGISRSKLYSSCDKYLGLGIAEYVRNIRIDYAKELLKNTDDSIVSISEKIGFCRVFRQKTGSSPKKYRLS
ncbi:MAG: AraC family transcriptional regulator [Lachnospiraceae bacterium]|nr:AraC family transcriptional regulator [Lachnospiraceae bacterium]